jgi:hypothetical protein
MAETEVIVTKFEADLSGLDKGVSDYEKQLNAASGATDKLDAKTTDLGASVGKLGPKFEVVKQSAERTHKEIDLTGQSIDQLKAKLATLTKARGGLIDPKAIAKSNADIAAVRGQITKLETSVKGAKAGAGGLFSSITQGASQAAPGLSNVTSLFGGMGGPIGIAAAAVAGFIANFSRLDSVKVFFDAVSIGFDTIGDRLANLDFKSFFDPKTQAEDAAFALTVANNLDAIAESQLKINKANAEAEKSIAGLQQQSRDRTKTEEERAAILDRITGIEAKRAKDEREQLGVQILNQRIINKKQLETLGEVSDANAAALNELQVQQINADTAAIALTENAERRKNQLLEAGASERVAISAKAAAAIAKADAEADKNAEARAQAQGKVDGILDTLAAEQLARTQTDAEKEIAVTVKKFDALTQATTEGFEKIRAASPPGEQAALFQQEADALIAIDKAKDAELAALSKARTDAAAKTQEENLDRLRKSLLSETDLQREAALQQLDADLATAEQTIKNTDEFNAFRIARVKQTEEEIGKILTDAQQAQLDADTKALEDRKALQEQQTALLQTAATDALALVVQAAASGKDVQEQASKAIIGIFLDTLEKIIQGQIVAITAGSTAGGAAEGGPAGAVAGLATGIALSAIIKGLFAVFKAQIAGNYQGDPYVSGTPMWSGRDGHLRRLDEGERVVTKKANLKHWDELEAMRTGGYDDLIYRKHIAPAIEALGFNDMGTVNTFVGSDTGQRIAQSVMLAKFYDAGIVGQLKRSERQGREQTEILARIERNGRRNTSRW